MFAGIRQANEIVACPLRCEAMKSKLPIGIQTFRTIREGGYYYVDKTRYVRRLLDEGSYYFLSRPRRFGKSLLVDTLKELLEGNEPLFRGLDIHHHWDWSAPRPVIRLSFGSGEFRDPAGLRGSLEIQLDELEEDGGIERRYDTGPARLRHLIRSMHRRSGRRVAVLVDEYDKPILDALGTPDVARANRDHLRDLYSVIKDCDAHVRFAFLTGVSKFSKVSLFSGLNNLDDITLDSRYSAVCGYTESDLDETFGPELAGLDRAEVRDWYNGYHWLGDENVYNPFDVLLLFRHRRFGAWWFETGTPTFLVETMSRRGMASVDLENLSGTEALLSSFDVDAIEPEALLFQTGYLTITEVEDMGGTPLFRLGYPNREVRQSLNEHLLRVMTPREGRYSDAGLRLRDLLATNDFDGIEALFRGLFSSIPYEWHTRNELARFEGYYASVFFSHFAAAGLDVTVEDSTSHGRVDMAVRFKGNIYLFEFKVVGSTPEGKALQQLRDRRYADKYRHLDWPIHLVGVEFSRESRNLAAVTVERV